MLPEHVTLDLSGDRMVVTYHLTGTEETARSMAQDICVEQTVEFPQQWVPAGDIANQILGRIESLEQIHPNRWQATISYAVETAGQGDLTQLLNVLFGNISIKPGVRLQSVTWPTRFLQDYPGPAFGRSGLRALLGVPQRPLLCTALKPMGLSAHQLADLAFEFALGGIDIIKDDHGLANQSFASWADRVRLCADAVARANQITGRHCIYMPNITGSANNLQDRAYQAKELGAGGLLIAPGLTGFDAMHQLSLDTNLSLPLMSHPAFLGSYVTHPDNGIAHGFLLGQLMRLAGADASVFPSYGGRFSFSKDECADIAIETAADLQHLRPIFPTPGGGMSLERVPELQRFYGNEVILLIGGGLFQAGGSIQDNTRRFVALLEETVSSPSFTDHQG